MSDSRSRNLSLIGYRATGKTTVGRILANRLGWEFVDVDDVVEEAFAGTIAEIFAAEGEIGFRDREVRALRLACSGVERVIATGGGIILREENRSLLRSSGTVVWLAASPEMIWGRLQSDPLTQSRRPNLTAGGGLAEVQALLTARESLYQITADLRVDADDPSPESVANAILMSWQLISPSR